MQRIRKGLYLLESGGFVNAYLIEGPRGLTLCDTTHAKSADALCDEIIHGGFSLKDIEQIVITHRHADHSGGAAFILERHRVKVYAHPADIPAIKGQAQPAKSIAEKLRKLVERLWATYKPLEVVVPLEQSQPMRPLPQWQVIHTPGHTPGSISLYQPTDKVLICGDALSNREGKLALSPSHYNDDQRLAAATARRLVEYPADVLCCGHGPVIRGGADRQIVSLAETV